MATVAKIDRITWDDQARELLAPCVDVSPWATLDTPENLFSGCDLWQVQAAGVLALVAVRAVQLPQGRMLEVVGCRSIGDRMTPADVIALDHLGRYYGADLLSMFTRHAHLMRAVQRAGWCDVGRVAVKPLRIH